MVQDTSRLLAHIDTAKREIAAAVTITRAKNLGDQAEAARQFGVVAKDPALVAYATEVKLRCERRLGEILRAMAESGKRDAGKGGDRKTDHRRGGTTLKDIGITRDISSRAQKLAERPENERYVAAVPRPVPFGDPSRRVRIDLWRSDMGRASEFTGLASIVESASQIGTWGHDGREAGVQLLRACSGQVRSGSSPGQPTSKCSHQ